MFYLAGKMELFPELQLKSNIPSLLERLSFACPISSSHLHSNLIVNSYKNRLLSSSLFTIKIAVSKKGLSRLNKEWNSDGHEMTSVCFFF